MQTQQIIIVACGCLAMMFSVVSGRLVGNGRRWTLLLAAVGLFAVAGYESYMTLVWEKTVSAAIRLDIFVIDFPVMFISIIAGVLAWSKKYTLAQVDQGVWGMWGVNLRLYELLFGSPIPLTSRLDGIRSMYNVYSDYVSKLEREPDPEIESGFYMWWDLILHGSGIRPDR